MVRGKRWIHYAVLYQLNTPWLDGPVIVAHDVVPIERTVLPALYPDREVWYYVDGEFSQQPSSYEQVP